VDIVPLIRLLFIFLLLYVADSQATEYPVRISGMTGQQYAFTYSPPAPASFTAPAFTANVPVRVPITIDQAPSINVPATITPNLVRVGALVAGLARVAGPIGTGLQIANLICSTTNVCQSSTDPSQYVNRTSSLPVTANSNPYNCSNFLSNGVVSATPIILDARHYQCQITYYNGMVTTTTIYYLSASDYPVITTTETPTTDSDWANVATKLGTLANNVSDLVNYLLQHNKSIPVDNPVLSPSQLTTPSVSTVIRDQTGNPVSTVTNTTTIYSNPTNTYNNNMPVTNITYNTVTTTTDNITNISTTTTTTNPNPPSPPEDMNIDFDQVQDVPLPTQDLPISLNTTSWGEGTCPADPSTSVLGHQIVVPVHVVCNYMTGVRMAVLAFFALISAYIIIGVKHEG
jgi:hypothetical protein